MKLSAHQTRTAKEIGLTSAIEETYTPDRSWYWREIRRENARRTAIAQGVRA